MLKEFIIGTLVLLISNCSWRVSNENQYFFSGNRKIRPVWVDKTDTAWLEEESKEPSLGKKKIVYLKFVRKMKDLPLGLRIIDKWAKNQAAFLLSQNESSLSKLLHIVFTRNNFSEQDLLEQLAVKDIYYEKTIDAFSEQLSDWQVSVLLACEEKAS